MPNVIEDALSPFKNFDMASIYGSYSQIIDGIIFFSIFLGLSRFAFHKRFPGRAGSMIAVAFSFALTIALLVMERQFNFNLKSFGGIAMGVIFLITGFFVITLARSAGMGAVISFSVTYCIIYLSIATVMPNLFDYIAQRAPFINGISGIVFLICLFITLRALWMFLFSRKSNHPETPKDDTEQEINIEDNEIRLIKDARNKLVSVDDIIDRLNVIEKIIKENRVLSPDQSNNIRIHLSEIGTKEEMFKKSYRDTYLRFRQLGRIDSERLQRLESELATATKDQMNFKQAEIDIERQKLEYDRRIVDLKTKLDAEIIKFNNQISATIQQLHNQPESTLPGIDQAKKTLFDLKQTIENIRQLERELINLHKTQKELLRGERKKR